MCSCTSNDELIQFWLWWADPEWFSSAPTDWIGLPASLRFCVSGFHRNEDMKAIDVLPILKEKVAFLSGQKARLRFSQHTHKDRQMYSGSIMLFLAKKTHTFACWPLPLYSYLIKCWVNIRIFLNIEMPGLHLEGWEAVFFLSHIVLSHIFQYYSDTKEDDVQHHH